MKKLMIILTALFTVSCAGVPSQTRPVNPYEHVNAENIKQHCQPAESWRVGVLGLPGFVFKFEECLKVDVILVVSVDSESYTEAIRKDSVDLLVAHYIEFLKRTDEQEERPKRAYSVEKINSETGGGFQANYYSLTYKYLTCTQESCETP
mgnify:CR=1 FL=1